MTASDITIKGAREHNLRDVDLVLPRNRLICFTGVSGSGKSSLAFDTLYAEGQRRYVESLSSFARQFLGQMPKPDVDLITGLSPSISISQKAGGQSPRSTVGTITEIYDYLRVLYARVGRGHCPNCGRPITAQSREQILARIEALESGTRFMILAPLIRGQKGEYRDLFEDLLKQGFARARVDGSVVHLSDSLRLQRQMRHNIEVVVDRLVAGPKIRARLAEAVEMALRMGQGNMVLALESAAADGGRRTADGGRGGHPERSEGSPSPVAKKILRSAQNDMNSAQNDMSSAQNDMSPAQNDVTPPAASDIHLSAQYACTHCQISFEPPSPQLFSFNSPQGMCPECHGLGEIYSFDPQLLVPDPSKSFQQGCVELLGTWRDMGRWRRHVFRGVADVMERKVGCESGTMLESAWEELDPRLRDALLWGTGDEHITFTWRSGPSGYKWGGKFEGIVPKLLSQYHSTQSKPQRRQLEKHMRIIGCQQCRGQRLNPQARAVSLRTLTPGFDDRPQRTLPELSALPVSDVERFAAALDLDATQQIIAAEAVKEIRGRLGFLKNVGLDYLTLDRAAPTLSGGEMQRIRLAGQIGCGLVGVLYILDEPSIGLHTRDNDRLLGTLAQLRDQGNTVVVVEHDEDTMRAADHIVDFGPGPGVRGGHVVAAGPAAEIMKVPASLTGAYLSGRRKIEIPATRRSVGQKKLIVRGAKHHNLKNVDIEIPLGVFVCVTGVSGSGKSSLVNDILAEALLRDLNGGIGNPGVFDRIEGLEHLDKMIAIDQSPIGRTPRSNPATYIKVFDDIRQLFTQLPEAKARGYKPGRFSFNVTGGRCEACEGNGSNRLEMDFLADIWVTCPVCDGHRFSRETLQIRYKGKSIADVLEMDIQEALLHFENIPNIRHKLQTLHDVGLDYVKLGQPSPTLSGGEAQRIKLARELVKKSTGRTLYLLDEPTTGLHFADIQLLLKVLNDFADAGNTVLVVEHNLEVIKTADWIVDLGPEGGHEGGYVVAAGTPEQVAQVKASHTGRVLQAMLDGRRLLPSPVRGRGAGGEGTFAAGDKPGGTGVSPVQRRKHGQNARATRPADFIRVRGAREHNLKGIDVDVPRDQFTVCCGQSGSGKSSLAMDTIYAEGQRRYVESLSAYARQFIGQLRKPKFDHIEGLSPAIAIEQKQTGNTPRSTVGTVTEIYDYLRILVARLGQPYCPRCDVPIGTQSTDEVIAKIMDHAAGTKLFITAPVEILVGERYAALWEEVRSSGYARIRVDGETYSLDSPPEIDRRRKHNVEVVVDRVVIRPDVRSRLAGSVEIALALGKGVMNVVYPRDDLPEPRWQTVSHSQHFACERCGRSFELLSPHHFSFNSPLGWCPACEGLGTQTGTNPAALLRDPERTLAEGAIALWPPPGSPLFAAMLESFCHATGVPADVRFAELDARHRRLVMHGTGDQWFDVFLPSPAGTDRPTSGRCPLVGRGAGGEGATGATPAFRFQYKGLYPALEEASRVSPGFRSQLEHLVDEVECSVCGGSRLRDDAAAVRFRGRTIDELCRMPLSRLLEDFQSWKPDPAERKVAGELAREIRNRLQFLVDVGLEYLTLSRPGPTLSGGESQRIRLGAQVGSGLCGVLYVLDEPTIGLHPRDNKRLLAALRKLRDLGNTLLVVEHDREVVASADQLLDFGPAAGRHGGQIVARGTPEQVAKRRESVTGPYLSGKKAIPIPQHRRMTGSGEWRVASGEGATAGSSSSACKVRADKPPVARSGKRALTPGPSPVYGRGESLSPGPSPAYGRGEPVPPGGGWLEVVGARHNNLKNLHVKFPLGTFTVVTGTSGSGKSSLVEDVLYNALARTLHRAKTFAGAHDSIRGIERINKVIRVDQQPLGQTPTSNPATFTGAFDLIRELYAQLPEAKLRGYTPRRFSFNVPGGRCEKCEGNGQLCIEMHFLPDVWVECDTCHGRRYNPETLAVQYRGKSVADVLDMSCDEAVRLFENIPKIRRILQTLCDVGLGYLTLGQSAPTLSGGEAQRVKLAAELARPDTGQTLYLLDEPTTGLHFDDVAKLLEVLNRLVDLGNTVVVIEHNLDVVKTADWVIDVGPEAGNEGGYLVVAGTPEEVVAHAQRWTKEQTGSRSLKLPSPAKRERVARSEPGEGGRNSETPVLVPPSLTPGPSPGYGRGEEPPGLLRSYTGEALEPVLAAGPHVERKPYDPQAELARREGDFDIAEVGRDARMPWEADGRRWHTQDRVGRNGHPCRWDGRILGEVIDRIQDADLFSDTDWNNRSVVEIRGLKKSEGWFFHAITAEEWLLKMKFRTARNTFRREELVARLDLKPLNDVPELPLYGTEPRVRCKNLHGPWQEVEVRVHSYAEIDRPEFWKFVEEAIEGFGKFADRVRENPDDLMPWKVLGRKWHFARKGFPLGKAVGWDGEVLEELFEMLSDIAPAAQFLWNNKQVVPLYVQAQKEPWAAVQTKKIDAVWLTLAGPKGRFALGRLTGLGFDPELDGERSDVDLIRLKFRSTADLERGDLAGFLREHLEEVTRQPR